MVQQSAPDAMSALGFVISASGSRCVVSPDKQLCRHHVQCCASEPRPSASLSVLGSGEEVVRVKRLTWTGCLSLNERVRK